MRGERVVNPLFPESDIGSSPHARGTHRIKKSTVDAWRFIPACAGNAARPGGLHGKVPVHPRMRGERLLLKVGGVERHGSSPHARGTRRAARRPVAAGRFIPACAGNAGACAWWRPPQPVHPRMRGERSPSEFPLSHRYGSSPHARGTRFSQGKQQVARAVHPRMRGERSQKELVNVEQVGSSPHARGTRHRAQRRNFQRRFIPACAGNATGSVPRFRTATGSSPHARGTRSANHECGIERRFIPACAGNAGLQVNPIAIPTVHPRMRGERGVTTASAPRTVGSSPHARGTHIRRRQC